MNKTLIFCSFLLCTISASAVGIDKPLSSNIGFTENKGQVIDQNNQLNPEVKYIFHSNGLNVQLRASGFSYDTYTIERVPSSKSNFENRVPDKFKMPEEDIIYHYHRVDIEFIGANKYPELIAEQLSSDYSNYYTTGTGVLNVRRFQRVTYKNLYDGIDLEFDLSPDPSPKERGVVSRAGNSSPLPTERTSSSVLQAGSGRLGGVKYNFILHPGADLAQIRWKYSGAFNTTLADGKISLQLAQGKIEESIPESYIGETANIVNVNYISFGKNEFGFGTTSYDKSSTLIIDPAPWSTYFGGTGTDSGADIETDANGNIYITGNTSTNSGFATSGAYQTTYGGNTDAFVAKFNSAGVVVWVSYFGGSATENSRALSTDVINYVIIAGETNSASGVASTGSYQTGNNGQYDGFIAKFDTAGTLQWSTYFGGVTTENINSVTTDPRCNILICGRTNSSSSIATTASHQATIGGGTDAFVARFSSSGVRLWSTYYGSTGTDIAYDITADTNGNVVIAGGTSSNSGITTAGSYQVNYGGGVNDAFIVKFDSSGVRQWATYYGIDLTDLATGLDCDSSGNIFIAGWTNSPSLIASGGAHQTVYGGGTNYGDAFVLKLNSSGFRQWATYYGGANDDWAWEILVDFGGNIVVTGNTLSSTAIATAATYQTTYAGGGASYGDGFVVKFTTQGVRLWGTYFGGSNQDVSNGVATNLAGNIFITGFTESSSAIASSGAYQTSLGGNTDAFIASFTTNGGLPVKLLSFDAKLANESEVICEWSTASELNNDYFEMERATGYSQCSHNETSAQCLHNEATAQLWEVIGKVKGSGTTNFINNYQFKDFSFSHTKVSTSLNPTNVIYYRLKQVDFDGTSSYSDIRVVNLEKEKSEWSIYPNPVTDDITVNTNSRLNTEEVLIEIYDLAGTKLVGINMPVNSQGNFKIDVSALDAGMYLLMIDNKVVKFVHCTP